MAIVTGGWRYYSRPLLGSTPPLALQNQITLWFALQVHF